MNGDETVSAGQRLNIGLAKGLRKITAGGKRGVDMLLGAQSAQLLPQARLSGPMAWVIAIMIALTVIAVAGGLALNKVAGNAEAEIEGGLTVQIVEPVATQREQQAQAVLAILNNREDVAEVRRVPDEELAELLETWLGEGALGDADTGSEMAIPVPALIDVRLSGAVTEQRLEELREELASSAPAARIDSQVGWLAPVFDAIRSLQWLAAGLVLLLMAASMAAVWLSARSALGSNRETIDVIHHLGGSDSQVAGIFQRSVALDAFMGGLAGLALGVLAVGLLGRQFAALGSGLVSGGGLGIWDWIILASIPFFGVVLAVVTARLTVISALRKMV